MPVIQHVGVLGHPTRPQTAPVAQRVAEGLRARGVRVWWRAQWTDGEARRLIVDGDSESANGSARIDALVAIGGDGAMLRAARLCAPDGVPMIGINMGHLGFLTEISDPSGWDACAESLLAGQGWIEQRMMIRVEAWRDRADDTGKPVLLAAYDALNDAVIRSGSPPRMIRLDTYIDKGWTTSYNADGLVISTPTGSTAYALAAGGPILPPEHESILIVPVAPHLSLERPIVLPGAAEVEIIVSPDRDGEYMLSADGVMQCELQPNDRVVVRASQFVSRFIRLRERSYFYRSLLDRLEPRVAVPHDRNGDRR